MTRGRMMGAEALQNFVRETVTQAAGRPRAPPGPKRIIVAYAEEEAAPLLDWAAQFGRVFHSTVWLTHVTAALAPQAFQPQLPAITPDAYREGRDHSRQVLESAAQGMMGMGIPTHVRIEDGWGPDRVDQVAREVQADLIIAGSPRRGTLARLSMGSFADALLKKLPCDLLQVRGPGHPHKILVAVDRSPESRHALRSALAVAKPLGASVAIIHALDVDEVQEAQVTDPRLIAWEGLPDRIEGVNVTYHLVVGPAADATSDFAQKHGADLLVVGTRHERGWRRFAHGSVATRLGHAAPASVWIVAPNR